jgi:hypothetical protein
VFNQLIEILIFELVVVVKNQCSWLIRYTSFPVTAVKLCKVLPTAAASGLVTAAIAFYTYWIHYFRLHGSACVF